MKKPLRDCLTEHSLFPRRFFRPAWRGLILMTLSCALFAGCSKDDDRAYISNLSNKERDSEIAAIYKQVRTLKAGEADMREGKLSEMLKITQAIYLDNSAPIGRVDKILFLNDLLCIFDRTVANELHIFDRNGRRLRSIGQKGDGPGEYRKIHDVQVNPFTGLIELWDGTSQKMLSYDEQGNLLRERKIDLFAGAFGILDSAVYVFYKGNAAVEPSLDYKLIAVDANLQEVKGKLFRIRTNESLFSVQDPSIILNYNAANGKHYFTRLFDDHIYSIKDRRLLAEYFVDFQERAIDANDIKFNQDKNKIISEWIFNPAYFSLVGNIMEAGERLHFTFNQGGRIIHAFHHKGRDRTHYLSDLKNDITGTAPPTPLNADEQGNVYFADEPGVYIESLRAFAQYHNIGEAEALERWRREKPLGYEIYNRVSEFDNPVILVGRYIFL